jgi:hypothetical protein
MPVLKTVNPEGMGAGRHIISQRLPNQNAEQVVLAATATGLDAGTVLGKVTVGGKYVILAPGASDGSQNVAGVLFNPAEISTGDQRGVADVRGPLVMNANLLVWPAGITGPQKTAALTALSNLGIQAR